MGRRAILIAAAALPLAACSTIGDDDGRQADGAETVVLITHDSFALPEELIADFESETGYQLQTRAPGDAGALVNQLILTRDAPLGDVVYGVDTTFASRALEAGVFQPYQGEGVNTELRLADDDEYLTPVDFGDVCINVDHEWFADAGLPEPVTLADLADEAYRDLLVVTNPATSSPGLAFLLATIGAFGEDDYLDYWAQLRDNGVKVVSSWSDAYYVDFSGPSSEGDRPLVLSYASSPPYEVGEAETPPTGALLDTCFRQVEYAGVLAGAENPEGGQALVDWLLSPEVQAAIPESMYVYPASDVTLPEAWVQYAPLAPEPFTVPADRIAERRDEWIQAWTEAVIG